ncbi:DNA polymerase III, subunit gamma and tau [Candidatus Roizmanbacteria bacterium CG09_land_8_20_14_0_10_41_9]|uniref:DNA polymerase III subunit gamma/tau n=1 Tax=Candidatus Roizmanbacteria bacterium CG09_land_8_20_14_0_10_41_9 TaxID=1974850 RepID=A0A2H0WSJ3_9BACT|nr:MAG: DNA polymerase III, subunit gamma and tau [Candidatus Roizmanbacteria bacterium CG09_land_8_20_14_0_10_41_9]
MFYLTYRPRTIEEIDNSRVTSTLKKILESKDLPHALLFVGQKGTGKTSAARIFSKAVNCLNNALGSKKNSSIEPCNKCRNCLSIASSSFTDVFEMDAASNRGIEEVKNLIKETAFLPMSGRYRVFIIDEAHMITPDGFNALLKTLEEPPDTTIFILATTNLEKVPKTIVSRCVKVNFGIARKDDIIRMLKRIVKNENIQLEENILQMIAQYSEHSFRDAAKILEEISMQKISKLQDVEKYLGIRGKNNLLEIIDQKDLKTTLAWIEEFSQGGGNFKFLIENILEELHEAFLHTKGIGENTIITHLSTQEILLLIKLLMQAYGDLRASPIESLPLEISIAEFYNRRVVDH